MQDIIFFTNDIFPTSSRETIIAKLVVSSIRTSQLLVIAMKVYLRGEKGCCPSVDVTDTGVTIGEGDNTCTMTHDQFDSLKQKITAGDL